MYYVFSSDLCGFCPVAGKVPSDAPIVVVAVCNHASFHMLSYLLDEIDVSRIQQIYFVDVSAAQMAHHKRTVQAIVGNPDARLKIIEDMTGLRFAERFHEDSGLLYRENFWRDCDVSSFGAVTGRKVSKKTDHGILVAGGVPEMCKPDLFLRLFSTHPKPSEQEKWHRSDPSSVWAGYDYGFLREEENLRRNLAGLRDRMSYVEDPIEDFCQRLSVSAATHVFAWVSNIMTNRTFRKSKAKLADIEQWPNWHLWSHTPGAKNRNQDAHAYAMEELAILAGDAVVEVIHTERPTRIVRKDKFFESYEMIGYQEFLKTKRKFGSLSLHILLGHGVPVARFKAVYKKALTCCERLFVMEHNSASLDKACFPKATMNIDDICSLIDVKGLRYVPGAFCNRRNFIVTCK